MREKLIELLNDAKIYCDECGDRIGFNRIRDIADHLIANGVTIQKHGHWILKAESYRLAAGDYDEEFYVECSECGRRIYDFDPYAIGVLDTHPYCNCGAKMDSVQEDGDSE